MEEQFDSLCLKVSNFKVICLLSHLFSAHVSKRRKWIYESVDFLPHAKEDLLTSVKSDK